MATFRGKVSTTCRDALDKMYAHLGVKLGRVIKEAHQGEANATRRIFSMGFSDTLAPMTGAFTATHMVTPTLTLGKCVLASAASATSGYSRISLGDNLAFDITKKPYFTAKVKFTRDTAVAIEMGVGFGSAAQTTMDAYTDNVLIRFKDAVTALATNEALSSSNIGGTGNTLIKTASHTFQIGDRISFVGVTTAGTELNGNNYTVVGVVDSTHIVIDAVYTSLTAGTPGAGNICKLTAVCETDDDSTNNDDIASNYVVESGVDYTVAIDLSDTTDVKFYINGVRVATDKTFSMSNMSSGGLQPIGHLEKGAVSTTASFSIEYLRAECNR